VTLLESQHPCRAAFLRFVTPADRGVRFTREYCQGFHRHAFSGVAGAKRTQVGAGSREMRRQL